jgi:Sugar (and other) transporter
MRGPLATTVQLLITIGMCVGYFACYGTVNIDSSLSWRLPLILQSGIAFILTMAAFFSLPHSPRWLAYKGRKEEASLAWDKLGVSNAEREKDLLQDTASTSGILETPQSVPIVASKTTLRERMNQNMLEFTAVFKKDARKPMFLGVFLMAMQQLSGIDGVIYVSTL